MEVLESLIEYSDDGIVYYEVENDKQKRWLFTNNHLKLSMDLYQPTSCKGKVFKWLFPYVKNISSLKEKLHIKKVKLLLDRDIGNVLTSIFQSPINISFFGGTPCAHQKAVLQISQGNEVKAYCKISNNKAVGDLFDKECAILQYLQECGMRTIPQVLLRQTVKGLEVFCQSNVKSTRYKTECKLGKVHYYFLEELFEKTKVQLAFSQSAYAQMLTELQENCKKLNKADERIVRRTIEEVENKFSASEVTFCVYHGDFTPWNMAVVNNQLYVFDFEYAQKTYPPFLDCFHFLMQTEIFIHHKEAQEILNKIRKSTSELQRFGIECDFYLKLYLLEIIHLYLTRSNEIDDNEKNIMNLRLKILFML